MLQEAAVPPVKTQNPSASRQKISLPTPKSWTADELKLVADEYRKGASTRAIAKLLPGRALSTVMAVIRRCQYNDTGYSKAIKPRSWTAEEKKKLLRLKDSGATLQDIVSQFPDRTHKSLTMALYRPRSDMFWSPTPSKKIAWTATADKELIERLSSGTSVEEVALLFGRSNGAIRDRSHRLGIRLSRNWTPEEDETLLRMISEGYTHGQIGSSLGRSRRGVNGRWFTIRPVDSVPVSRTSGPIRRTLVRPIEPTSAEMQTVERLRQEGSTWQAIKASIFPDREMRQVYRMFQRVYKHHPEKINARPRSPFSPSEIEDIESLLKDRVSWRKIAASRFPDLTPAKLRRSYLQQIDRSDNSAIHSVDIPEVKRLHGAGLTWKQIAVMKYPGIGWQRIREVFLKQTKQCSEGLGKNSASTGEETKKEDQFAVPLVDVREIQRLRSAGFTWRQIAVAKYPGIRWWRVRERYLKQLEPRSHELDTDPATTREHVKKEEEKEYSAR